MNNEKKHKPTPWKAEHGIYSPENGYFSMINVTSHCLAYVFEQANADHIVKCVNMHDELVEALKVLFYSYKGLADSGDAGFWKIEDQPEGKQALVALEKAGAL